MRSAITTQATIEEVTVSHQLLREELYRGLLDEFEDDLDHWHASVHQENLTMSFHESDGMFASGQSTLNAHYMTIFGEFYPRYINVIEPYVGSILEIRIEGHTSKGWQNSESELEAYLNNLGLSQNRALSVLKLLSNVDSRSSSNSMLFSKFTSIGYSSAKPLLDERGLEDIEGSRRVAFRIILPELTDTVQLLKPSFN